MRCLANLELDPLVVTIRIDTEVITMTFSVEALDREWDSVEADPSSMRWTE